LFVEMMRPKSPGLMICPVFGSILPPDHEMALRLLIGLENSARNSMFFD
jgi:hypothetical protein